MMTAAVLAYEPEDIKPGWVALVLVLALALATYLLWRSMNKQLDRIDVPTQQELRDAENSTAEHRARVDSEPEDRAPDGTAPDGRADPANEVDRPPGS